MRFFIATHLPGSYRKEVMKKSVAAFLIALGFILHGVSAEKRNPLMAKETLVWAGIDYSMIRLVGPSEFRVPDMIFPGMFEKWNALYLDERVELLPRALDKHVAIDIGAVTERNKKATAAQVIESPGPKDVIGETHIDKQAIIDAIRSYKMEKTNGLGLVYLVDRFVEARFVGAGNDRTGVAQKYKIPAAGAVYIVFFDVASREVISTERFVETVNSGANFRNFWFGIIKGVDEKLGKYR